jgi:hypothetical protein
MKLLTLNFLTCAVKACKSSSDSFPLHPKECELVSDTIAPNPQLIQNILPRLDWRALSTTASEVHPNPHSQEREREREREQRLTMMGIIARIPYITRECADIGGTAEGREDDGGVAYAASGDEC